MARRFFFELQDYLDESNLSFDETGLPKPRLLVLKSEIYQIVEDKPVIGFWSFVHDKNPLISSLAIWLLSKSASRFFLLGIDEFQDHPSPIVRKHVAKALRSLEAWEVLESMAAEHPEDEAVQFFAKQSPNSVPYEERLARFATRVDASKADSAIGPSRMSLWFLTEEWSGAPAKSIAYIRRVLRRIHQAVHGN